MRKILRVFICIFITVLVAGCARKPGNVSVDPYEKFNRAMFAFNQDVDHLVYRPVAKVYRAVLPHRLRSGIGNAFDNIEELNTLPNDLLQGRIRYIFLDFWRFVINSTVGVGGLFDVASKMGLPRHYEDFGMTFAYWSGGVRSPYLVIPFLGPSTFRTAFGLPFNVAASPWPYISPGVIGWSAFGLKFANIRAQFLDSDKLVDDAFDPYIFVRNAYLQRRNAQIDANMKLDGEKLTEQKAHRNPVHYR